MFNRNSVLSENRRNAAGQDSQFAGQGLPGGEA
jgi:hypothetical protein